MNILRTTLLVALIALGIGAAPASAASLPGDWHYFATPSGHIVCENAKWNGGYHVLCTDFAWSKGKGQKISSVFASGKARTSYIDGNAPSEDVPKAKYNVTYKYHGITCRIGKTTGIKCVNKSHHGFRLTVGHHRTF